MLRCCSNFDPGVTSSRAFVTLGGAVPHGNTRGLSGMELEGLLERDQRFRAHLTLKARSEPLLRPPVSRSLARLSPLPATPLPMFVQAEGESRRDSGAEHSKKVSARQGPGRGRPGTERATHPQPLRRSASLRVTY